MKTATSKKQMEMLRNMEERFRDFSYLVFWKYVSLIIGNDYLTCVDGVEMIFPQVGQSYYSYSAVQPIISSHKHRCDCFRCDNIFMLNIKVQESLLINADLRSKIISSRFKAFIM